MLYERVPDVILLDIDLPGKDGCEVARGKFFRHENECFIHN
jgi:CheY-like chemotaxis protein